jgi:hypothetical protein
MKNNIQQQEFVIFNLILNSITSLLYFFLLLLSLNCFFAYQIKLYLKKKTIINVLSTHSILFLSIAIFSLISAVKPLITMWAINFDTGK